MKFGLEIFDIGEFSYPEVTLVETEIGQLTEIWELKNEWDKQWDNWKEIHFKDLEIEEMDNIAEDFKDKYQTFSRDVKEWGVFTFLKN